MGPLMTVTVNASESDDPAAKIHFWPIRFVLPVYCRAVTAFTVTFVIGWTSNGWTCALVSCEHPVLDACALLAASRPTAADALVTERNRIIADDTLNSAINGRIVKVFISCLSF